MKTFILFLRHLLRSPLIWIIGTILLIISFFSFGYAKVNQNLPCAVYAEDSSEITLLILDQLEPERFYIAQSREEVLQLMQNGSADCGIILLDGLDHRMEQMDLTGCAEMWVSPRTSLQTQYSLIVSLRIFNAFAPYLTERAFRDYGYSVSLDEINAYFERIEAELTPLTFIITNVEGVELEDTPGVDLPLGLIAVSGFIAYGFYAVGIIRRRTAGMKARFGKKQLLLHVYLPRLLAAALVLLLCTCVGILLGSTLLPFSVPSLLLAGVLYYVILTVFFALLLLLPFSDHALICFIALDASVSLVLCPLFWDIASYVSWLRYLRIITVPYWMYLL